jgi:hypothetical protein
MTDGELTLQNHAAGYLLVTTLVQIPLGHQMEYRAARYCTTSPTELTEVGRDLRDEDDLMKN